MIHFLDMFKSVSYLNKTTAQVGLMTWKAKRHVLHLMCFTEVLIGID